tara:strand:+ start:330 stop:539 length:210 start_codon:yes stop_codon:yes gene_type:complete
MKKITYFITIIILLITPLTAAEKKDCSEIKKFSKAYLACKSGNIKAGINISNPLKKIKDYQKKAWSKKN